MEKFNVFYLSNTNNLSTLFSKKIGSVHYHHCVQRREKLQMHNLKKYLGILDYALRAFSKGFPIYEILLNIWCIA